MQAAAEIHQRFGRAALPNYIISKADAVSDILEVALMVQQTGMLDVGRTPTLHINIIPLFETITDLQGAARSWTSCSLSLSTANCCKAGAIHRKVIAGLFRQQ